MMQARYIAVLVRLCDWASIYEIEIVFGFQISANALNEVHFKKVSEVCCGCCVKEMIW